MSRSTLSSCAIILVSPNIERTVQYYRDVAGFRAVEHYEGPEKFAALYRDAVEIVLVQSTHGEVQSNRDRYGAGFDAYLVPETVEAVDTFCEEIKNNGAKILQPPTMTPYGSREFTFEDIDGRQIGVGRIKEEDVFFRR